jgi:hypothetical protein
MESSHQNNETLQMQQALARATEAVAGNPNADPLQVFPDPRSKECREDVVFDADNLTPEQETDFRAAMAELGPGRKESIGAQQADLPEGYNAVLEGGKVPKFLAELELVLADPVQPRQLVITGGIRPIPDKEKELTAKLLGIEVDEVGDTEFDVECQAIKLHPKFESFPEGVKGFLGRVPGKVDAAYNLESNPDEYCIGPRMGSDLSGPDQFVELGMIAGGKPVIAMRVDRFPDPENPDDASKYIQPSTAQKIGFAAGFVEDEDIINYGRDVVNCVALVTSATYEPTCTLAALKAEDKVSESEGNLVGNTHAYTLSDIHAHVLSYGTIALAKVKGEEPKQPSLSQLATEAYKTAKMLMLQEVQ